MSEQKADLYSLEGMTMAESRIDLPHLEGEGAAVAAINQYYAAMREKCRLYVEQVLYAEAVHIYTENPDPYKRFTHRRFLYTHTAQVSRPLPGLISVFREMRLSRGAAVLRLCHGAEVFEEQRGRLLPPGLFLRRTAGVRWLPCCVRDPETLLLIRAAPSGEERILTRPIDRKLSITQTD